MAAEHAVTQADWQGITLLVGYCPSWLGMGTAHIEVRSPCPIPITETGYRSHFLHPSHVEMAGGPVAYVLHWLEQEADAPAWRAAQAKARQLSLF